MSTDDKKSLKGISVAGATSTIRTASSSSPTPPKKHATPLSARNLVASDVVHVRIDLEEEVAGHEQGGPRPWVVISDNARLHQVGLELVYAVPLTKTITTSGYPSFRILVPGSEITTYDIGRLQQVDCTALPECMRSISTERVEAKVGKVTIKIVNQIFASVGYLMGF